jgi:hypothetical protein
MYTKNFTAAIAAALFASANAHFMINIPDPIAASAIKDPLAADGSNFPCHGADLSTGSTTTMAAGSTQPLGFNLGGGANTAVHGGGSCQISLTYETDAAKLKDPASWKVIHSMVGGCPTDAKGNLDTAKMCDGTNAGDCVNSFSFQIPNEVQNGAAVLAWTWFNNVGNREMYMNCAKVSLTGGTNSMGSLPSMFVANLAGINQCTTTENFNLDFPNPGSYVTKEATLNYPLKAPGGTCPAGAGSANVPASGSSAAPAAVPVASSAAPAASYPAASAPAASSPAASAPAASNPGGVFAPGASSAPAAGAPTATSYIATTFITAAAPSAAPAAASPAAVSPAAASPAAPAAAGACLTGQVACSASGFYCIDAMTFGECAFGCATPMKMSDGTNCNNGGVIYAVGYPGKQRRSMRHVHKRHFGNSF